MSDDLNKFVATAVKNQEQAVELMEKLFAVAQPGAVYSEPITAGEHMVITASEVKIGMGFGYGSGGGVSTKPAKGETTNEDEAQVKKDDAGFGDGGGGGGVASGRPVAVINISPGGVRVEPVVDVTKVALALFTTLGSMLLMLGKMRRASKG